MTPDELEDLAMVGAAMPNDLSSADVFLFQCYRALHAAYRYGAITREQAKEEKQRLLKEHHELQWGNQQIQRFVKLWQDVEGAVSDYAALPSIENADKIIMKIYGTPHAPRKTDPMTRHTQKQ